MCDIVYSFSDRETSIFMYLINHVKSPITVSFVTPGNKMSFRVTYQLIRGLFFYEKSRKLTRHTTGHTVITANEIM